MSTEPFQLLETELPESTLSAGFRAVQDKRLARVRTKRILRVAYLAVSIVVLFVVRAFLQGWHPQSSATTAALALHYRGGAPLAAQVEARETSSIIDLDDGSRLALDRGAALTPTLNDGRVFGLNLTRGRTTFDVKPGGPRRWEIDAGIARVVVLGTKFSVARRDDHVVVVVERGHVRVESDALPGRARDLYAGDEVDVSPAPALASAAPSAAAPSLPSSTEAEVPPAPTGTPVVLSAAPGTKAVFAASPSASTPLPSASAASVPAPQSLAPNDWRTLARDGNFKEAYALLGPAGFANEVHAATGAGALLSLSDIAKSSGHPADARAPLERVVAEFPLDAALAAFSRARLELDAMNLPGEGAQWFARALALGLSEPLRETAMARRVEALHRAGDASGAKHHASAYLSAYPQGRYREAVTVWSAP